MLHTRLQITVSLFSLVMLIAKRSGESGFSWSDHLVCTHQTTNDVLEEKFHSNLTFFV